ncbi:hypothetical protein NDU88_000174 [Pleurodeles waltl]|uniref:Uncharacterized protein n=1 Tax=Pleurodeles waltl TaxID=8319 RepID=A0AAV7TEP8_PLEWA|nr:hypothetical protein NDU88_000174 [Pleurodeles waltl]
MLPRLGTSPLNHRRLRSGKPRRFLSSPLSSPAGQHGRTRDLASQLKPCRAAPGSAAILNHGLDQATENHSTMGRLMQDLCIAVVKNEPLFVYSDVYFAKSSQGENLI